MQGAGGGGAVAYDRNPDTDPVERDGSGKVGEPVFPAVFLYYFKIKAEVNVGMEVWSRRVFLCQANKSMLINE